MAHKKRRKVRQMSDRRRFGAMWVMLVVVLVAIAAIATWRPRVKATPDSPAATVQTQPQAVQTSSPVATAAPAIRPATGAKAAAALPVGSGGQRAFVDPRTGQLRPMEHDDVVAAAPSTQRRAGLATQAAAAQAQEILGPNGAIGMAVPEDLMTFTVATKTPDGRVVLQHATGLKDAQAKARGGASKAGEESRDDR